MNFNCNRHIEGASQVLNHERQVLRLKPLAFSIRTLIAGGMALSTAHAELPVPVNPINLPNIATQGQAAAAVSGNAMTITQGTDKARIDWQSFNIDAGSSVRFDQPSSTSVALNNIHQADPSRIMGSLTANGQVYLVNQNGFVFGKDSQVNVNSLVATTLGVSESVFQKGLTRAFENNGEAALQGSGEVYLKDTQGNIVHDPHGEKIKIQIFIEPGAHIKTNAPGGRVIIAAPVINNAGTVSTPDGQTILAAAKDKVYLQEAGSGSDIRGLLVEVGTGGEVNNMGQVLAERGNASLMGFAVNQKGIASATTSVSLNGSVRLLAREGIQDPSGTGGKLVAKATTRTVDLEDGLGTKAAVHLERGSVTQVALDSDKTATAIDAQAQDRSQIEISGHDVHLHTGSAVQAKSGHITITALDDPSDTVAQGDARIFLETGSQIDASGVKNVAVPMSRNIVKVELRKNELRDAPLQRDGILYGQTVSVDVRDATLKYNANGTLASASIPVADIKGAVDRTARNIDERSTSGGTVSLASSGDVVSQKGSLIDFSGGSVAYQDGVIETTQLVAGDTVYDIAKADADRHYDSILGRVIDSHDKWGFRDTWVIPGVSTAHFEAGYSEGKAGGKLLVNAYETLLNGTLDGSTTQGIYQRDPAAQAPGSTLAIDLSNNNLLGKQDVVFNQNAHIADINANAVIPHTASNQPLPLALDAGLFQRSGISHVSIKTNGTVSLQKGARLDLPNSGSLNLAATGFNIQGSIVAPSGTIALNPISINELLMPSPITLGADAVLDVSGVWVNDVLDSAAGKALQPLAIDGGSVSLVAEQGDLRLEQESQIKANGGAWLDNQSQLHSGTGGDIALTAATHDSGGVASNLILQGDVQAWSIDQGGSLSLNTSAVTIANSTVAATDNAIKTLALSPDFFRQQGFADYRITSSVLGLQVADHVTLKPQQQNLQLDRGFIGQASGRDLLAFTSPVTLPDTNRNPVNLHLAFSELTGQDRSQTLRIGEGALISTDIGGRVQLDSNTSVWVDGTISTPGGSIGITINTPRSGDKGFYAGQGIWLGSDSHLLAQGAFKPELNPYGLHTGQVLSGGDINLTANRGYIVTRAGSGINVSGTAETLQFFGPSGISSRTVASDGGNITLKAGEGILADGSFRAQGGGTGSRPVAALGNSSLRCSTSCIHAVVPPSVAVGGKGAAGGTLSVELNRGLRNKPLLPISDGLFPDDIDSGLPRSMVINQGNRAVVPADLAQGGDISAAFNGKALLKSGQLNNGGFASLMFKTDVLGAEGRYAGNIRFNGDVTLHAGRQIILDTPTLSTQNAHVNLNAPYVSLGSSQSRIDTDVGDGTFTSTLSPAAKTGPGKLTVNAKGIDLLGGLSFSGFNTVNLLSRGDIRAIGIRLRSDTKNYLGELKLAGDLTLKGSQVYPATLTDYKISLTGKTATAKILSNGTTPAPVYSAGGQLAVNAAHIIQKGVLKAPLGGLSLNARHSLTLAAGSLTSVSGDGRTVLFGQGSGGFNWLYPLDSTGSTNLVIDKPPEKHITLNGKKIALKEGAKVDLSGGGDLYAYEFITGPGGSVDVLDANSSGFTEKYAVLPGLGNALTPYDPQESAAAGLSVGQGVYLSAGSGLAAGWYTLLPAHYALLPGAYLVTPKAGTQDMLPGSSTTDLAGSTVVSGRYGVASAGTYDGRWQGFTVEPGSIARTRSQYTDYLANTFFPAQALKDGTTAIGGAGSLPAAALPPSVAVGLPKDAGSLAITAQTGLSLGAQVSAAPFGNGLGGQVDISATQLAIIGRREQTASVSSGTVSLLADDLNQLNAPSLLLGGVRSKTSKGQHISVAAKHLTIAGDAHLQGAELLLAAQDEVRLQAGAVVESTGKNTATAGVLSLSNKGAANSDGAFVRVSSAAQAEVSRSEKVTGKTGTLVVEEGAELVSEHSMRLDSTKDTVFAGSLAMQGGSLALAASKISLGAAPADTGGLVLPSTAWDLDELVLTSASDLNIYGPVAVNAGHINIDAAHINGFANAGQSAGFNADLIHLENSNATSAVYGDGTGRLTLTAKEVQLGSGNYAVAGFDQVNINASTAIKGLGQSFTDSGKTYLADPGKLTVAGDLSINAARYGGDAGATTTIDASGHHVSLNRYDAGTAWSGGLGASWTVQGDSIRSNAYFDLPSGRLALTALQGDVDLTGGFVADVSGRTLPFGKGYQFSPAGQVLLEAGQGSVLLAEQARLELAGASQGGQQVSDAGALSVNAQNGQFVWDGIINTRSGTVNNAFKQGQFSLQAHHLGAGGFSALNSLWANAGFTESLALTVQQGDVEIAAMDTPWGTSTVTAHQFQLAANNGQVDINGVINANGTAGGTVSIYGRQGIHIGANAQINAKASSGQGGSVLLDTVHRPSGAAEGDTGSGLLALAGGVINVSGAAADQGGSVHLRTGRDDATKTVAVSDIRTGIIGADKEHSTVEAVRVYDLQATSGTTAVIKAPDINTWRQDTQAFMANAPTLANFSGADLTLLPGIEIRSSGDLSLNSTWNLLDWRYSNAGGDKTLPGFLTLRAGGDLNINATLTDAFATAYLPGQSSMQLQDVLQPGQSWSYQLSAGHDIKLANSYLAPSPYGTGEKLTTQVMVRTGTGDIGLHAGGDIEFVANANDSHAAAAVYTMGRPAQYTRGQLLGGEVPGVPAKLAGETDAEYLNRLDPVQMNELLRYGYFSETLLGLAYMVAEYPTDGGAVTVQAGGNITGIGTGQQTSDWLVRSGVLDENNRPTAWGINVSGDRSNPTNGISEKGSRYFNQNIGALGGGDVQIRAGGSVQNLSVMLPTTGKAFGQVSESANQWTATGTVVNGGGDLAITAGQDIVGGEYYLGRGTATLSAGGGIVANPNQLGAVLALGEGQFNINARRDVVIASVLNPTVLPQSLTPPGGDAKFFTYNNVSGVGLTATAGNVVLQNDTDGIRIARGLDTSASTGFEYAVYPSRLAALALSGDVRINRSLTLFPSAQGALQVLAGRNIGTDDDAAQSININMSDADPSLLPSVSSPTQQLEGSLSDGLIRTRELLDPSTPDAALIHATTPLHTGDSDKPQIIARLGDIAFASSSEVTFFLPQAADFIAGRDISNLSLSAQNLSVNDSTQISAGRDLRFDTLIDDNGIVQANDKQIELGGPGQLHIQAGRTINLGGSAGINTIGNTKNTNLSASTGADINVLAGVGGKIDSMGFINQYFTLTGAYLKALNIRDDDGNNVLAGFSAEQKLAYLKSVPEARLQKLLLDTLFSEIKQSAAAAAAAPESERKALYQRGFDAIATLFPDKTYQGDLSLVFSQIKTLAGGGINLAVPGGAVNVGLAGKVGGIAKGADELGIVAQQAGDVNAFSLGDFNVNQSRVFTMGGGDIAIWSSKGNIDAGKGAKSAISAPAPITSVDAKGNIITIFPPIVSGSGIQTINPQDKTKKQGNVYLAAPVGVIDAGEAGISGGKIVIAANAVVGAANISASGGSVGVPTAVAPPVVSAGAANAAASAAKQASPANDDDEARNAADSDGKKATVTMLNADVVGYGECSVADVREGKPGCGG